MIRLLAPIILTGFAALSVETQKKCSGGMVWSDCAGSCTLTCTNNCSHKIDPNQFACVQRCLCPRKQVWFCKASTCQCIDSINCPTSTPTRSPTLAPTSSPPTATPSQMPTSMPSYIPTASPTRAYCNFIKVSGSSLNQPGSDVFGVYELEKGNMQVYHLEKATLQNRKPI